MVNTKVRLILFFAANNGQDLYSQQKATHEADCGLRSWALYYKLQAQTPYDYTVKVTNRFKELNQVDRVPEHLWTEVCNSVQEAVTKTIHPQEKELQEGKVVVWEDFTNCWEEKRSKKGSKREREVYSQLKAEFQRKARRDNGAMQTNRRKQ